MTLNLKPLAIAALVLGTGWYCAADAPAKAAKSKAVLTVRNLSGNVSWTPKTYGYGSFTFVVSVPTTIVSLDQLSTNQPGFQFRIGTLGLNAWDSWLTKSSGSVRSYLYTGTVKGKNVKCSFAFALHAGELTVSISGNRRNCIATLFNLANTDSSGTATLSFGLDLRDVYGNSLVTGSGSADVDFTNKAGKKSSVKLHHD